MGQSLGNTLAACGCVLLSHCISVPMQFLVHICCSSSYCFPFPVFVCLFFPIKTVTGDSESRSQPSSLTPLFFQLVCIDINIKEQEQSGKKGYLLLVCINAGLRLVPLLIHPCSKFQGAQTNFGHLNYMPVVYVCDTKSKE